MITLFKFPKIRREALLLSLLMLSMVSAVAVQSNQRKALLIDHIDIHSKTSIIHLGSIDTFDITEAGQQASKFLLDALNNNNLEAATAASTVYDRIIPKENYGGEYTALQWFAWYLLAPPDKQQQMLSDKYHREFFNFWSENDFANLKEYLERKYKFKEFEDAQTFKGQERLAYLEDFILFNNPRREEWEKTSKMMEVLNLEPGMTIADIGSGPGYFTFKFSEAVGAKGKVLALDTVKTHVDFIKSVAEKYDFNNIEFVHLSNIDSIGIPPNQVDLAYMCSLYHIIYTVNSESVRQSYIASIRDALKPGGRFIVVDNAVVEDKTLPYHGPFIAKELIIAQLERYGFQLETQYQFIPQRYVLVFRKV